MWLREDGTPYYVGKGTGNRAFTKHRCRLNHVPPPKERILVQEFPDESAAFAAEVFLISFYGRKDLGTGCLVNFSAGGEGFVEVLRTKEHNRKIGQARRRAYIEKGISDYTRQQMSLARKGRTALNKGVPMPEVQRAKHSGVRLAARGRKQTAEQIAKRVISRRLTLQRQGRTV